MYTGGARIIERSQEYKSTVKYRTFVYSSGFRFRAGSGNLIIERIQL